MSINAYGSVDGLRRAQWDRANSEVVALSWWFDGIVKLWVDLSFGVVCCRGVVVKFVGCGEGEVVG